MVITGDSRMVPRNSCFHKEDVAANAKQSRESRNALKHKVPLLSALGVAAMVLSAPLPAKGIILGLDTSFINAKTTTAQAQTNTPDAMDKKDSMNDLRTGLAIGFSVASIVGVSIILALWPTMRPYVRRKLGKSSDVS